MKKHYSHLPLFITLAFAIVNSSNLFSQKVHPHDTSYYVTYTNTMARIYLSKKYAPFSLRALGNDLEYRANTKLNLGVGVTYKNYTVNVAYGL